MISALHLLWIVAVAFILGFCAASLFHAASDAPDTDSVKSHMIDRVRHGKGGI